MKTNVPVHLYFLARHLKHILKCFRVKKINTDVSTLSDVQKMFDEE
jgi:dihydroxyacid dehydratase/phosphogluconate dehydratase